MCRVVRCAGHYLPGRDVEHVSGPDYVRSCQRGAPDLVYDCGSSECVFWIVVSRGGESADRDIGDWCTLPHLVCYLCSDECAEAWARWTAPAGVAQLAAVWGSCATDFSLWRLDARVTLFHDRYGLLPIVYCRHCNFSTVAPIVADRPRYCPECRCDGRLVRFV